MKEETLEEYTEDYKPSFVDLADTLSKQETLEDFINEQLEGYDEIDFSTYETFIELGAKWQQEKDNKELLFFREWIFDQFNLNKDVPVSKIIKEYLTIKKL